MKKVLFVDAKHYRFSFYYQPHEWWLSKGIYPYFKNYEHPINKWKIYLWVILNHPYAVVFVQLSLKNILLARLCNAFNIKTIFWQHGVFKYDKSIIQKYKKINSSLDYLLVFSDYDLKQIKRYFRQVNYSRLITHYNSHQIALSNNIPNSILYIGQILTKQQIKESNAQIFYDENCEKLLNGLWQRLESSEYKVFLKKHPGDKSNYLYNLTQKYPSFQLIDDFFIPSIIIGHYSTLIIPYIQINIPLFQIENQLNKGINFNAYTSNKIHFINKKEDFQKLSQFKIKKQQISNKTIKKKI